MELTCSEIEKGQKAIDCWPDLFRHSYRLLLVVNIIIIYSHA